MPQHHDTSFSLNWNTGQLDLDLFVDVLRGVPSYMHCAEFRSAAEEQGLADSHVASGCTVFFSMWLRRLFGARVPVVVNRINMIRNAAEEAFAR
jgi:hypothetical protein